MPRKAHKSEYTILLVLAVVTGFVLFWLARQGMIRDDTSERQPVRTTRSAGAEGMLACYMLFEQLGIEVSRSNRMLLSPELQDAAVVFLIDPIIPVHPDERMDLGQWVARGGVLVTTESMKDLDSATDRLPLRGYTSQPRNHAGGLSTEVSASLRTLPLARDVSTVCLQSHRVFDLKEDPSVTTRPPESLFADSLGVRIVGHQMGRGRILVLSDSSFLANNAVARDDNSVLAANLAAYALTTSGSRKITFDDYHFGAGGVHQGFGVLGSMLFTTSAGWCVLTLTAAGLLYLILRGRRFGPRRDFRQQQRRRSKLEYVHAVGATYRAAGAHGLTFQLIYGWFRQRIAARTGLSPAAANRLLARALAGRGGQDPDEYERVLDRCDALRSQNTISQHQLATALAQLARLEKETLHGFGDGKRDRRQRHTGVE
jgi:hypothetical protein